MLDRFWRLSKEVRIGLRLPVPRLSERLPSFNEAGSLCRHFESAIIIEFVLYRHHVILRFLVFLDLRHLLFILSLLCFLVSYEITELHLLFDKVLGLGKRANKLFPLFFLEGL